MDTVRKLSQFADTKESEEKDPKRETGNFQQVSEQVARRTENSQQKPIANSLHDLTLQKQANSTNVNVLSYQTANFGGLTQEAALAQVQAHVSKKDISTNIFKQKRNSTEKQDAPFD